MFQLCVLLIALVLGWKSYERETQDFYKIENKRKEFEKDPGDIEDALKTVERVRRVTWRWGIMGALVLSLLLVAMRAVQPDHWLHVAVPAWVVITSCLNFRAYHVEDEGTLIMKAYLNSKENK